MDVVIAEGLEDKIKPIIVETQKELNILYISKREIKAVLENILRKTVLPPRTLTVGARGTLSLNNSFTGNIYRDIEQTIDYCRKGMRLELTGR